MVQRGIDGPTVGVRPVLMGWRIGTRSFMLLYESLHGVNFHTTSLFILVHFHNFGSSTGFDRETISD